MESTSGCPCVTVLIPARNAQQYIGATLDSVMLQDHVKKVIVIVNDSMDDTESIVRGYILRHPKIHIVNLPLAGIARALNAGIELVDTRYIARVDADDLMVPNRIVKQVAYMDEHTEFAVLGSQIEYIDKNGFHCGFSKYPTNPFGVHFNLAFGNPIAHPSVIIRSSCLEENRYDLNFEGVEDLALWIRLSSNHRLGNIDLPLTKYRMHENQVSASPKLRVYELELRSTRHLFNDSNFQFRVIRRVLNQLKIFWLFGRLYQRTPETQ